MRRLERSVAYLYLVKYELYIADVYLVRERPWSLQKHITLLTINKCPRCSYLKSGIGKLSVSQSSLFF